MLTIEDLEGIDHRIEAGQFRTAGIVVAVLGHVAVGAVLFLLPFVYDLLLKAALRCRIARLESQMDN